LNKNHSCPYCIRELEDKCLKDNTKREQIKEIRDWLLTWEAIYDTKHFVVNEFDKRFKNEL
jgi:hypothetical protein